jgi:hypothetical protein
MWQGILVALSTLVGLVLIGFCVKYRRTGLGYSSGLWVVLTMAAGVGSAVLAVAATVDDFAGWLIPAILFFIVFFQAVWPAQRVLNNKVDELQGQQESSLLPLFEREPKVVDYDEFALGGDRLGLPILVHARRDGVRCEIVPSSLVLPLSELIELADNHVCVVSNATVVMKAVA